MSYSCDSLSNLYLWHIKYSSFTEIQSVVIVVIRFQICIFDILNTARSRRYFFATGCDSLSNLYLWHIKYSSPYRLYSFLPVVIRFQICIFDILNTADTLLFLSWDSCDSLSNLYLWHIKYSYSFDNSRT